MIYYYNKNKGLGDNLEVETSEELIKFSQTIKVLVVQDDISSEHNSLDILEIFFSNMDIIDSLDDAYEKFILNKYNLIILNLNIRNKEGIDLISKIRDISKDITILVISSETSKFNFSKLIKLGIDGFIIKPVYIKQFSEVIHKTIEVLKNKQELFEYRLDLEKKVQEQVLILREKDKVLLHKSKLAAMGEMMDSIAHQWKQPLNIINIKTNMMKYDYEDGFVNDEYCDKLYSDISSQTAHMKNTLDEFRTFLRPDKQTELFLISDSINKVLLLINDELMQYKINIEKNIEDDFKVDGIENEFKHILLNLISNSKDAFHEKKIKDRLIKFNLLKQNDKRVLEIIDNAGGIPLEIIENIFNANFTSKDDDKGTGMGLYMSKQIITKHNAEIYAKNVKDGVKFKIVF